MVDIELPVATLLRADDQHADPEPDDPDVIGDAALDRGATSGLGFS